MSIYGQVISNIPRAGLIIEISSQDLNLLSEDGINFRPHNRANHGVTPQDIEWIELRREQFYFIKFKIIGLI